MVDVARFVDQVNKLEPKISGLTDSALQAKTREFKDLLTRKNAEIEPEIKELQEAMSAIAIPEDKEKLKSKIKLTRNHIFEEILPEAFAVVREAASRTIGLRHFDTQIAGGFVLHEGRIAEMATGEGKTLVATLSAYTNALLGKGVHVVTVNDYLARRDREWMGPVYEFLGLSIGVIQHEMSDDERKVAYACDITYGTNNEFGFDYLRDNMKYSIDELVQRQFFYAIVDEVDSILVDEARTPLIISGPAEESTDKYYTINNIVPRLKGKMILEREEIDAKHKGEDLAKGYEYIVDEKAHTAYLTEEGEAKVCSILKIDNLHDIETMEWRHHVIQALYAHNLYKRDVDYVVKDGQVIIVDEFTGRMMPGRRWSDGLHQAVEAKEGMRIERENQTLATITFQNYFRMYEKLAGMTGTAFTEANEFEGIYQLDVVVIPTNRKLIRTNYPDLVFKAEEEKFNAVVEEIVEHNNNGQPVLVGTISIDKSEHLSELLKRRGVTHQVLNAKYHELEAQIVAQAGRYKAVTIATNMAGRGTDILLGGNPEFMARNVAKQKLNADDPNYHEEYKAIFEKYKQETMLEHEKVVAVGGLHVLATERHEARRIDNQLRGRCGRQGDPGSSRFYVSFGDDLMRLFAPDWIIKWLNGLDTQGESLTAKEGHMAGMFSKSIETAQHRVEQQNYEIRKQLLEYDTVMNKQREIIYGQRKEILEGVSLKEEIIGSIDDAVDGILATYAGEAGQAGEPDAVTISSSLKLKFNIDIAPSQLQNMDSHSIRVALSAGLNKYYLDKEQAVGEGLLRHLERMVFLQIIDSKWKDHLYTMDKLREGIRLRAYAQRDPLIEYKREAFQMFTEMCGSIKEEAVETVFKLQPAKEERFRGVFSSVTQQMVHPEAAKFESPAAEGFTAESAESKSVQSTHPKVGRNEPCPCGSGKKYKKCCGK
ncbi:MAG: preprotein translocase subunit SecA [Candidatus Omnitrophica bacterium]|nr:preprotein translocase subunit SecA [Candidatus Omnitrophota bacterium]